VAAVGERPVAAGGQKVLLNRSPPSGKTDPPLGEKAAEDFSGLVIRASFVI
jgi:hypothetical protein